eukprot:scaffold55506_cov19-Tisochrysis_lutea.AAC.1
MTCAQKTECQNFFTCKNRNRATEESCFSNSLSRKTQIKPASKGKCCGADQGTNYTLPAPGTRGCHWTKPRSHSGWCQPPGCSRHFVRPESGRSTHWTLRAHETAWNCRHEASVNTRWCLQNRVLPCGAAQAILRFTSVTLYIVTQENAHMVAHTHTHTYTHRVLRTLPRSLWLHTHTAGQAQTHRYGLEHPAQCPIGDVPHDEGAIRTTADKLRVLGAQAQSPDPL